jgi:thioredoxin-dependent peroxiredoxin
LRNFRRVGNIATGFSPLQVIQPMSPSTVEPNTVAPDFKLKTESGGEWQLSNHRGSVVALLFYPKDETFVCTRQLCSVRDNWNEYLKTKAVVVGVSPGSVKEHQQFAQHHRLPLTLLADADGSVTRLYTERRWLPVWFTRAIVIVDAKGIIRHRRVMLRSNRPTDYSVISSIYAAQTDLHLEKYEEILQQHRLR